MTKYFVPFCLPDCIDYAIAAPLLLLRWIWYGYAFRRIKIANYHKHAVVDPKDYHRLSKHIWFAQFNRNKTINCVTRFSLQEEGQPLIRLHRQIMQQQLNAIREPVRRSPGEGGTKNAQRIIDHIDNDPLNNTRSNLRLATRHQNTFNRGPIRTNTASKYKGVSKARNKWRASIKYKGQKYSLGHYDNEIDAAKAYDTAAKKFYKEFAYLNFPKIKVKGLRGFFMSFPRTRESKNI